MNQQASDEPDRAVGYERGDSPIRVGSPFAAGSIESTAVVDDRSADDPSRTRVSTRVEDQERIEKLYDVGPIRYTAMGAVAASMMVAVFAAIASWWFPFGGVLIAALGSGLSIFGMYSAFRITSFLLLMVHLSLFVFCYTQTVG